MTARQIDMQQHGSMKDTQQILRGGQKAPVINGSKRFQVWFLGACKCLKRMAPQVGLEPTTLRLTAGCSAIELLRSGVPCGWLTSVPLFIYDFSALV